MENRRMSFFLKAYCHACLGFVLCAAALLCAAAGQAANVTLAWDPSPDPVTGYRIFYGEQSVLANPATEINVGNVLQYTITTLTPGTTTVHVDLGRGEMLLHMLDLSDPGRAAHDIERRFEIPLRRLFPAQEHP